MDDVIEGTVRFIKVDVEGAEEGTQFHAKDLPLPSGSTLLDEPDLLILNVLVPAAARADEEAEEEAAETTEAAAAEAAE